ncbi:MAG: hypothetical protein HRU71_05405 [Planctomycetia bacterium]|nr:MAG: hypothetical protein HRU71_05405 [Planctomycetia bacterium]
MYRPFLAKYKRFLVADNVGLSPGPWRGGRPFQARQFFIRPEKEEFHCLCREFRMWHAEKRGKGVGNPQNESGVGFEVWFWLVD